MQQDIRWKQRLEHYCKAVEYLKDEAGKYANTEIDVIKKGIIQSFEIAHELAWKVMQDYLKHQGITEIGGPRNTTRTAFNHGLLEDGEVWINMVESRNLTVHTYDELMLTEEFNKIIYQYLPQFIIFRDKIKALWEISA